MYDGESNFVIFIHPIFGPTKTHLQKVGTPIHEIMHALGFLHEQNRADRDQYVRIQYGNIKPETTPNFDKASPGETTEFGVKYDTSSVMHYSSTAFSSNGGKTIIAIVSGIFILFNFSHNILKIILYRMATIRPWDREMDSE